MLSFFQRIHSSIQKKFDFSVEINLGFPDEAFMTPVTTSSFPIEVAETKLSVPEVHSPAKSLTLTGFAVPEEKLFEKLLGHFTLAIAELKANHHKESYRHLLLGIDAYTRVEMKLPTEQSDSVWHTFVDWVRISLKIEEIPKKLNFKIKNIFLNKGIHLFHEKKYNDALENLTLCIKQSPCSEEGYFVSGKCYQQLNKLDEAYLYFNISRWTNTFQYIKDKKLQATHFITYSELIRTIEIDRGELEKAKKSNQLLEEKLPLLTSSDKVTKTTNRILFSQKLLQKARALSHDDNFESALNFARAGVELLEEYKPDYKRIYLDVSLFTVKILMLLDEKLEAQALLKKMQNYFPDSQKIKNRLDQLTEKTITVIEESKEHKRPAPSKKIEELKTRRIRRPHVILIDTDKFMADEKESSERKIERIKIKADLTQKRKEKILKEDERRVNRNLRIKERRKQKKSKVSTQHVLASLAEMPKKESSLPHPLPKIDIITSSESKVAISTTLPKKMENDFLDCNQFPAIFNIPLQSFERDIIALLKNKCCLVGSTARERIRQKLAGIPAVFDMKQDRDFSTSCSDEEVMSALTKYKVTPSKRPGSYCFHACDHYGNQFKVDISISPYQSIFEDVENRDHTVNGLYVAGNGNVIDPTGLAFTDIKNNTLRTIKSPKVSYTEDPWRIFRGRELAFKNSMSIHPETEHEMKENISSLKRMKQFFCVHSWMAKSFSYFGINKENAAEKFNFLVEHNFLSHLFDAKAEKFILEDKAWVLHQLQSDSVKTREQIYMIFYVSIALKAISEIGEVHYQKYIFSTYTILYDVLNGFPRFGSVYSKILIDRENFYRGRESLPQREVGLIRP